ncbi:MAG TPA: hypothetical protein VEV84_12365, partial [Pyrinomonadaceae bacterium]|nr:hypothetical protein [Pyrinomonadaceae bacterium]
AVSRIDDRARDAARTATPSGDNVTTGKIDAIAESFGKSCLECTCGGVVFEIYRLSSSFLNRNWVAVE